MTYFDLVANLLIKVDHTEVYNAHLMNSANDDVDVRGPIRVVPREVGVKVDGAITICRLPTSKIATSLAAVLAHCSCMPHIDLRVV
jgi:hypothetical protein